MEGSPSNDGRLAACAERSTHSRPRCSEADMPPVHQERRCALDAARNSSVHRTGRGIDLHVSVAGEPADPGCRSAAAGLARMGRLRHGRPCVLTKRAAASTPQRYHKQPDFLSFVMGLERHRHWLCTACPTCGCCSNCDCRFAPPSPAGGSFNARRPRGYASWFPVALSAFLL